MKKTAIEDIVSTAETAPLSDWASPWSSVGLRSVIDHISDGVFILRADGMYTLANAAASRILDLPMRAEGTMLGNEFPWVPIHPDGTVWNPDEWPIISTLRTGQSFHNVRMGLRYPNGDIIWLNNTTVPIFDPDCTTPAAALGTFADITEQVHHENTLKASASQYRAIFEASRSGSLLFDPAERLIEINSAACRILGVERNALFATALQSFVHPDSEVVYRDLILACRIAQTFRGAMRFVRVDRQVIDVAIDGVSFDYQNQPHYLVTFADVTERVQQDLQLRESRAKWRSLVDNVPSQVTLIDRDAIIASANWAPADMRISQMIGRSIHKVVPVGLETFYRKLIDDLFMTGRAIDQEVTDESGHWFACRIGPVYREGQLVAAVIVATDITSSKRIEQELRERESQLRLVLEGSAAIYWDANVQTGELILSPEWGHLLGCPSDQLPRSWDELSPFVHSADSPQIAVEAQRHLRGEIPFWQQEYRLRHAERGWIWVHSRGKIVQFDSENRPLRMAGIVLDHTLQKEAEARIREQANLLDQAAEAIVVRDFEDRIVYWNRGAERVFGWTSDEIVGQVIHASMFRHAQYDRETMERSLLANDEWRGEVRTQKKNGTEITTEISKTLLRDASGLPQRVLIIATDITDKKRLEQQFLRAQRLEGLGMLAGGIAHDLNNVLTPIRMGLDLLNYTSEAELPLLLNTMQTSIERGTQLIRQILAFAKGGERQEHKTLMLKTILHEMGQIIERTFPKSIRGSLDVGPDLWLIRGDGTQIHQLLLNLCVNARDAMSNGGKLTLAASNITLGAEAFRLDPKAKPGNYVQLTVRDTGTGIPPSLISKIFDPFFTTREPGKGTGLGLSTVLGIAHQHGGFVLVESEIGRGTTFDVYLPSQNTGPLMFAGAGAEEIPMGNGELILIVDDEERIRQLAQMTLEAFDYQVLCSSDGTEAVTMYAQHREDIRVVLMDLTMPAMDGETTIGILKKINPEVVIIATSGRMLPDRENTKLGIGENSVLFKPYTGRELLVSVNRALKK